MGSNGLIYLASRSPRRQTLLDQIGIRFSLMDVDIDETPYPDESAADFACRMALEKAENGWNRLAKEGRQPVLGADTVVVLDGRILGKPHDRDTAEAQLSQLSGRSHEVLTAVALAAGGTNVRLNTTRVWFREISPGERAAYCATGEPLDKAGSYAVQGLAAAFISRLEGSYSGVMGLPLFETAQLLAEIGVHILEPISKSSNAGETRQERAKKRSLHGSK